MSYIKRQRYSGGHALKINGKLVNIHFAKIVYRCDICLSPLERHNFGLRCIFNPEHRGFIHREEARKIEENREKYQEELTNFFEIVNGKVVIK